MEDDNIQRLGLNLVGKANNIDCELQLSLPEFSVLRSGAGAQLKIKALAFSFLLFMCSSSLERYGKGRECRE